MDFNSTPPLEEQAYTDNIISMMEKHLEKKYAGSEIKRFFHPKMHGLVKAEFTVATDISMENQVGIFLPGVVYGAYIRFSNARRSASKDSKKDFRGLAIKLIPGKTEDGSFVFQDFILASVSTFEVKNVRELAHSIKALTGNIFDKLGFALFHFSAIVRSMKGEKKCSNLLQTRYWSQTAYRFGNTAVKYSVVPSKDNKQLLTPFPSNPSDDFLKEQLVKDLSEKDHYMDFMVQIYADEISTPVNNPSVEWETPFIKLANIRIPKQIFNTPQQVKLGEDLAFAPWNCQALHEPLGSISRVRKAVYAALSKFRHERNHHVSVSDVEKRGD